MRTNGPWLIESSESKFRNRFVEVVEDQVVGQDGNRGTYATVTLNPGVAVLAVDEDGQAHLTHQFRYALGRRSIEVVCGAVEPGEEPRAAAQRELREELGYLADEWIDLGAIDVDTSILRCPMNLYLARELRKTKDDPDPSEDIEPITVPFEMANAMAIEGAITHSPSCVVMLKAARLSDQLRHHRLDGGGRSHA